MHSPALKVLFLAAEAHPFVTAGGLGEVAYALPRALRALANETEEPMDIDVRLVIPYHAVVKEKGFKPQLVSSFQVAHVEGPIPAQAYHLDLDGVPVYLIDGPPFPAESAPIYAPDASLDGHKFTFFSLAALELARQLDWQPDVLHANDWHTSPAIYALWMQRRKDGFLSKIASLLGLHNLPYLGVGAGAAMNAFGLPPADDSELPWWAKNMPLPLGLLTADHIVAVSPTYAQEILTPEFGSGLEDFLNTRAASISGILNGLDLDDWNPEKDPEVKTNFSLGSLEKRKRNKTSLQAEFELEKEPRTPLLVMITRLDHQKGVDLALDALLQVADKPWQTILLGTGQPELENAARRLEADLPGKVRAAILYNKAVSRRIYAGADMSLIPSRYEPCGLTQMISMRYGCVPVARSTGGLRDTIQDYTLSERSTGFLFQAATPEALAGALRRALHVYNDPQRWGTIQQRAMQQDFSWKRSARQYANLYLQLMKQHKA